jgi:WD40 repeat protein
VTTLATGSADGTAAVWRVAQPGVEEAASAHDPNGGAVARVDVLEGHPSEVYGVTFVGDGGGAGPVLATASGRGWIPLFTTLFCSQNTNDDSQNTDNDSRW